MDIDQVSFSFSPTVGIVVAVMVAFSCSPWRWT
jgi:hypothetical protein